MNDKKNLIKDTPKIYVDCPDSYYQKLVCDVKEYFGFSLSESVEYISDKVNKELERAKKPCGVFLFSWDTYCDTYIETLKHDENGFYFEVQKYCKMSHKLLIKYNVCIDERTARFSLIKYTNLYKLSILPD